MKEWSDAYTIASYRVPWMSCEDLLLSLEEASLYQYGLRNKQHVKECFLTTEKNTKPFQCNGERCQACLKFIPIYMYINPLQMVLYVKLFAGNVYTFGLQTFNVGQLETVLND